MIKLRVSLFAALLSCLVCSVAQAQTKPQTSAPAPKDEIVVTGVRIPKGPFPLTATSEQRDGKSATARGTAEDARMFVRCARPHNAQLLRGVIDGPPNQESSQWALDRIIRFNQGCFSGFPQVLPPEPSPYYGVCNPQLDDLGVSICHAFYDRGALLEYVLRTYAPDLALTTGQMLDPAIRKRFRDREAKRGKRRFREDHIYFNIVACIVALQPELASQMLRIAPNAPAETDLRNALIGLSARCFPATAKKIVVNSLQFRIYVTDALYFWEVAVRGTDTLIPDIVAERTRAEDNAATAH